MRVEMRATPVSATDLAAALGAELRSRGRPVNPGELALLVAHVDFETANRKALWNWNIGNITTTGTGVDYWQPTKGAAAGLKFRAYASLADGVRDYVATLVRARAMLDAAEQANPDAFAMAISTTGYTPGIDVQAVVNTLAAGAAKYSLESSNGRVVSRVTPRVVASVWGAAVVGAGIIFAGTVTMRRK